LNTRGDRVRPITVKDTEHIKMSLVLEIFSRFSGYAKTKRKKNVANTMASDRTNLAKRSVLAFLNEM
jgi:hypothetical protein